MSLDLSAEFSVFVSGEREMLWMSGGIIGLVIAFGGLFILWWTAIEREQKLSWEKDNLHVQIDNLKDSEEHWRDSYDQERNEYHHYALTAKENIAKLKDELEECKLGKLQVEKTCDILEEQAIRFSKSNVELGEKILKYKECIDVLLKRLSMIRDVSHGLPPFQGQCDHPDDADNVSDSVSLD